MSMDVTIFKIRLKETNVCIIFQRSAFIFTPQPLRASRWVNEGMGGGENLIEAVSQI